MHNFVAGAAELSKIISARAERGLYLSTARLFHKRFPRLLALFFIFYKVNEIVPPPALLSTVFVRFSTIFKFLPLLRLFFGNFCVFKQKVIHSPYIVDNSILFFMRLFYSDGLFLVGVFFDNVVDFGEFRGRSDDFFANFFDARGNVLHFAGAFKRVEKVDELAYALDDKENAGDDGENHGGGFAGKTERDRAEDNQHRAGERHAPPLVKPERAEVERADHADKASDHSPQAEQHGEQIGDKAVGDHASHA